MGRRPRGGRASARCALLCAALASATARADDAPPLSELSLAELMDIIVTTPTRHRQAASDSPATVYVITEEEILRYGLRDLRDILRLVPGVEWSFDQMTLQGGIRGFATNFSQTLLMING